MTTTAHAGDAGLVSTAPRPVSHSRHPHGNRTPVPFQVGVLLTAEGEYLPALALRPDDPHARTVSVIIDRGIVFELWRMLRLTRKPGEAGDALSDILNAYALQNDGFRWYLETLYRQYRAEVLAGKRMAASYG